MKRIDQSFDALVALLSPMESSWKDAHAETALALAALTPIKKEYAPADIVPALEKDFDAGMTLVRSFLSMSKDEFTGAFAQLMGPGRTGKTAFAKERAAFLDGLGALGLYAKMAETTGRAVTWVDLIEERLRAGRGSAIKGQKRGRGLEDAVEVVVKTVFGEGNYETRCRFVGRDGVKTEKTDFAIPNRTKPEILIEAKAYGATGSKLTDILGDLERIVAVKRRGTDLLLVTDGVTWKYRANDLRKIVAMQNAGDITKIYTTKMFPELQADLQTLKGDHGL